MNVNRKTHNGKNEKNKQIIPVEPVSKLSDSLHKVQTSTSLQFDTLAKKQIVLHVETSTTQLSLFLLLN